MMRFIVDCLRPTRTRAAAAQRDSVELQASDTCDTEIKELEDAVQREEKTLQMVKTLRCETQEDVERLEDMKSQLREKLKMMEHLEEQERKVLQSLQEEQQELEQTIQQYDVKLRAVSDSVLQLQMEVACAKAHAENMHVRIAPLQDSFEDILQVKKKLDELISGFVTDEPTVQEPSENPEEPTCGKLDVLKDNYDCYHKEEIGSEHEAKEVDDVELERSVDEPDQTQCSADNLKSSGSSSFTEITLTEVKEEHVMFRSTTSHLDSSDMEEEDFEIVQSSRDTDRQFDFFNPNPFIDGDVFGDDHFPKADVTERLPSDPFKGTDPFASDTLFVDILDGKSCQENFNTKEKSLPETVHSPLQSTSKDRDYGTFNSPVNLPLDAHARRPNERLYPSLSMPTESKCLKSRSNTCPEVETITTIDQTLDAVQVNQSLEAASPPLNEDCVLSHSSSEFDSFEGHCSTISAVEEEDTIPPGSLCGLQKIIAGSYTDFPLSPCYPHPDSDMTFGCQYMITHETNDDSCHSELPNDKMDLNNAESNDKKSDTPNHFSTLNAYDYKYGDMYFFTVRLDPGSPELHNHSPVCLESDDVKKCGSQNQLPWKENSLSPEFNDTDEFKYCNPKPKDTIQHCMIDNYKKGSDKVENEMVTDSVSCGNPHIPHFTNDDPNACESLLNSDAYDPAIHILDLSVQDTECVLSLKSSVQDLYSADQFCTYENLKSSHSPQSDSHCSERLAVSKSELQYFDPFSPISTESADCLSESEEIYTINCHDASRLDSGYHEADTPTALHQETNDTSRYSFALQDPCRETRKESNCEFTDPFSLKSFDTKIYDSEIENYESDYVMSNCQSFSPQPDYIDLSNSDEKAFSLFNTVQCNVLSDHHCGSEPNDCYTFGPLQHRKEGYTNDSNEENYMPELVRDNMPVCGETKPSPLASNACLHYGWKTSEPHPENHSVFMCSKSAVDSPVSKMDKQADNATNHTVDVTLPDLADIDYFCSELSKMVSSHSSDSVQQSVTEMLFGSDPNTSSFYPWDFEKQQYHS